MRSYVDDCRVIKIKFERNLCQPSNLWRRRETNDDPHQTCLARKKKKKNESRLRISSRVVVEWPIKIGWYGAIIFIASGPPRRMWLPLHSYVTQLARILYVAWKTIVCWRFLVKTVLLNVGVVLCILNRLESLPTESPHRLKLSKRPSRTAFLIYTELRFILFHYSPIKRFFFFF